MKLTRCACAIPLLFLVSAKASAQTADATTSTDSKLPDITVTNARPRHNVDSSADTARALNVEPGYAAAAAGGVSALPVLNGFAADRLKVKLDGMEITSACGNQMNSPMSYMPPSQLGTTRLMAGITPVSEGGDNIGGTIALSSPAPQFAKDNSKLLSTGSFSVLTRSVNAEVTASVNATVASDTLSVSYTGSSSSAESYVAGNGQKVLGSQYESNNHALTLAARGGDQQLVLKVGQQYIPYQGFPNQYMDMTDNHATFVNLGDERRYDWGKLYAKLYWQQTEHAMGFFSSERPGTMPMNTTGRDMGYSLRADFNVGQDDSGTLRLGNEWHSFRLNDYWPAVTGSSMMGPNTYVNINNGTRDRFAVFAEWEQQLSARWSTLFGIRDELVKTNTDDVQAYGNMMTAADTAAAAAFNASNRARTDNNIDLTALARFTTDERKTVEFGYARKTRSPNLYERYTWGRSTMGMTMTNWFGDGNGYVGNINLKPEVANTLSGTVDWHSEQSSNGQRDWFVKFTPYVSYVENYIDADVIGTFNPYSVSSASGVLLQFANHDAYLYGANLSWKLPLAKRSVLGDLNLTGKADLTYGRRTDGGNLYHMMPFNALLALEQQQGLWNNRAEVNYVARKTVVDSQRLEPVTASYTLVNLKSSYQATSNIVLSAGISNLFNRNYAEALGGVYLSGLSNTMAGGLQALPGYGRSFDVGMIVSF